MTDMRTSIMRGGQVVTPSEVVQADILIEGERIVGVVAPGSGAVAGCARDRRGRLLRVSRRGRSAYPYPA